MHISTSFVAYVVAVFINVCIVAGEVELLQSDCVALTETFKSTNVWKNLHWTMINERNDDQICCQYNQIKCDEEGKIIGIDVSRKGLSGKIHFSKLLQLQSLKTLHLASNQFTSTITNHHLKKLPKSLRILDLNSNQFKGDLSLKDLSPSIQSLDLSRNQFEGNLDLKNLSQSLVRLNLLDNQFKGDLDLKQLPKLSFLSFADNDFNINVDIKDLPQSLNFLLLWPNKIITVKNENHWKGKQLEYRAKQQNSVRILSKNDKALENKELKEKISALNEKISDKILNEKIISLKHRKARWELESKLEIEMMNHNYTLQKLTQKLDETVQTHEQCRIKEQLWIRWYLGLKKAENKDLTEYIKELENIQNKYLPKGVEKARHKHKHRHQYSDAHPQDMELIDPYCLILYGSTQFEFAWNQYWINQTW